MKTMTKILTATLALGGAMTMSGCANAHDGHGPGYGPVYGYAQPYGGGWDAAARNRAAIGDSVAAIHAEGSAIEVWVVPTDEGRVAAQEALALL